MAAQVGKPKLVQCLLHHGADPTAPSCTSPTTPICIAAQNGFADVVAILAKTIIGRLGHATPATIAAIDATNRENKTPACLAVELGEPEVIGVLMRAGADLRRASPEYYSVRTPSPGDPLQVSNFDTTVRGNGGCPARGEGHGIDRRLAICASVDHAVYSDATSNCPACPPLASTNAATRRGRPGAWTTCGTVLGVLILVRSAWDHIGLQAVSGHPHMHPVLRRQM